MKSLCLLLLSLPTTLLAPEFRMPHAPKRKPRLETPRAADVRASAAPMRLTVVPKKFALTWEYDLPLPRADTTFSIQEAPSLDGPWTVVGSVQEPPFPITTDKEVAVYRIETKAL